MINDYIFHQVQYKSDFKAEAERLSPPDNYNTSKMFVLSPGICSRRILTDTKLHVENSRR